MPNYLLELGCEEIPARMLAQGVNDLALALKTRLAAEGLAPAGSSEVFAGPRRMAVRLCGIPARQEDSSERIVGPPADRAFDAEGKPTRAALGFAQKLGVGPEALERVTTPKGVCLAGTKFTAGEIVDTDSFCPLDCQIVVKNDPDSGFARIVDVMGVRRRPAPKRAASSVQDGVVV